MENDVRKYKVCKTCGKKKLIKMFHKEALGKFGVKATCAECRNKWQKNRAQELKAMRKEEV